MASSSEFYHNYLIMGSKSIISTLNTYTGCELKLLGVGIDLTWSMKKLKVQNLVNDKLDKKEIC